MDTFDTAMIWIITTDSEFCTDGAGNESKFGITKKRYPEIDIPALTIDQAREIYLYDYWNKYRCEELKPAVGLFLLDRLIQHEAAVAVRMLQLISNQTANGIMSDTSINSINRIDDQYIIHQMCIDWSTFYSELANSDKSEPGKLKNRLARLFNLHQFIYTTLLTE